MKSRKYALLTGNFFRGEQKGQIASIWKARETRPEKVEEYKKAIAEGDVILNSGTLSKSQKRKLWELGVCVPEEDLSEEASSTPENLYSGY